MCGIIASFNLDKFKELILLNQNRGNFSYSFTTYNTINGEIIVFKDFGEFDFKIFPLTDNKNLYYIGHLQSPTGGLINDFNRIHPSIIDNTYLYHNGILKETSIKNLQIYYNTNNNWDTKLLHYVINNNINLLNNIDGSFGCLYLTPSNIKIFRNDLINLYVDEYFNISSTYFNNSANISSNIIYKLNVQDEHYELESNFKTFNNPYFFG